MCVMYIKEQLKHVWYKQVDVGVPVSLMFLCVFSKQNLVDSLQLSEGTH